MYYQIYESSVVDISCTNCNWAQGKKLNIPEPTKNKSETRHAACLDIQLLSDTSLVNIFCGNFGFFSANEKQYILTGFFATFLFLEFGHRATREFPARD